MAGEETELGRAVIPIRATLDKLDKDLADVRAKVDSSMSDTTKKLSKQWDTAADRINDALKKVVVVGLASVTAAVAGVTAALTKLTIDALPLQGIQTAFEGIAGASNEMLATLREGSLGMVSDVELMRQYNSAAQLVSKTFADQLPEAMGYLAKVSASTGDSMSYLLDSLVRGVGRLSPMIADNLKVQIDAAAANEVHAKALGKTADALSKAEQQTAFMNEVMRQLAINTAALPEVVGTTAQKWASFQTTIQNVKDGIGTGLLPAFDRVVEILNRIMGNMQPVVDAFRTLGSAVAQELDRIMEDSRWYGEGIGNSLAQGIYDAIPYIIAALRVIGDIISYWLSPGSPPRIAPDLDRWGQEAATIYMDAWRNADFSAFDFLSGQLESALKDMVASGALTPEEFVSTMLGSRTQIAKALTELSETGAISEETISEAEQAAGPMAKEVRRLLEALSQTGGEERAISALIAKEAQLARIRADEVRLQQEALRLQEQMAQAAGGGRGGGGAARAGEDEAEAAAAAQWDYNYAMADTAGKLDMMRDKLAGTTEGTAEYYQMLLKVRQLEQQAATEQERQAKDQERIAQDAAEQAERVAQAEWDYQFAIADTNEQIAMMEARLANTDQNTVEYYDTVLRLRRLQEQKAEEERRAAEEKARADEEAQADLDAVAQAQWDYQYSLQDTAGKLEMMRERLGGVEEGSVEYYRVLQDIGALERQLALEREREAGRDPARAGIDLAERAAQAQWDYNYAIADTAGKLAMLREKLTTVEEGSAEYWRILTQIAMLEKESKGGAGLAVLGDPTEVQKRASEVRSALEGAFDLTEIDKKATEIHDAVMKDLRPAMDWLKEHGGDIEGVIKGIGIALGVAAIASTLTSIAGAIAFLVTPLGLVSLAVAGLALAWANWDTIRTWCDETADKIEEFAGNAIDEFTAWTGDTWESVKEWAGDVGNKVETTAKGIYTSVTTWLGDTKTNAETKLDEWKASLDTKWGEIETAASTTWQNIKTSIGDVVDNLWENTLRKPLEAMKTNWENFWSGIKKFVTDLLGNLHIPVPHVNVGWDWVGVAGVGVWVPNVNVQWYGEGGDFVVSQPTLIGVGERGAERVQITPAGEERDEGPRNVYYITAVYRDTETESDLYHTIRALQMAGA